MFIHRLGEIRDRTYENQRHRACGLNLLVTAIILWNTRYLERAVTALRQIENVPSHLLVHLQSGLSFLAIGPELTLYVAYTVRGDNIRIITARRAEKHEQDGYYGLVREQPTRG